LLPRLQYAVYLYIHPPPSLLTWGALSPAEKAPLALRHHHRQLLATMPGAEADSPDETFFNDLSQQVPEPNGTRQSPPTNEAVEGHKDDSAAKAKRIACVLCRKRKLRCDGTRPTCGTCKRLAHDCAYDEVRKKSGPKRGYVKLLEARLRMP
jgi:hypothetical protein